MCCDSAAIHRAGDGHGNITAGPLRNPPLSPLQPPHLELSPNRKLRTASDIGSQRGRREPGIPVVHGKCMTSVVRVAFVVDPLLPR